MRAYSLFSKLVILVIVLSICIPLLGMSFVHADDIPEESFSTVENKRNSDGLGALIDSLKPDYKSAEKVTSKVSPLVSKSIGIAIGILILGLQLLTVSDIFYLAIPPIRRFLGPVFNQQQSAGGGGMGLGMGLGMSPFGRSSMYGSGLGMSPFGGGGMEPSSRFSQVGGDTILGMQWVSDEAVKALMQSMTEQQQVPQMMGGLLGSPQPQAQPKAKNAIRFYAPRRVVNLVITVLVIVLLSSGVLFKLSIGGADIALNLITRASDWLGQKGGAI